MNTIGNCQVITKLYESSNSLIYRAVRNYDKKPIILKILKENYPTPSELARYRQEYEITRSFNTETIIKVYDLQRYENSLVMFVEDFGGESLKILISQQNKQFSLEDFLRLAIKISEGLVQIHGQNIIHKDINSSNIIVNLETEEIKIIDFGISTRLYRENPIVYNPNQLEGTLAYISPEQTGRMNRGIDYRSDFYSLGVTFYELLTNCLPFTSNDSIELVHCHIAQQPIAPRELVPSIPIAVSNIVMKLLAKTPETRYQSARGIKADLQNCLGQLQANRTISNFSIGDRDISDRFQIPEKLYGREKEVTQLLSTFARVSQGSAELVLVSGFSGIGKSALVNEIQKPIVRQRGYFISGKFDQLKRDIPYAAFSQAFQDLIQQLLTESETSLQTWKEKLLEALGTNSQIVIEIIPELEKIIGKQVSTSQLEPTEIQNKFNLLFPVFIQVFSTRKHPLVIFLDDLQWADLPSLKLIELLTTDVDSEHLLIIGAYRDNEVDSVHPLILTLDQIRKAAGTINTITLYPLALQDINQLIAETLNCIPSVSQDLSELLNNKTKGNPFFLIQLLQSLYQENFLFFDEHKSCWQWNVDAIEDVDITDNVVDLMIGKIEKLDRETQNILKLAACIGNRFNLEMLSYVNAKSQATTSRELQQAIQENLILPLSNDYTIPLLCDREELESVSVENSNLVSKYPQYIPYKFLHDRVQQAAYALISNDEKKKVHLKIANLLLENTHLDDLEDRIFDIVNQFNEGEELISDDSERIDIALLNLKAGQKAKYSTAYEPALNYLKMALKLLSSNSWNSDYQLTLDIYIETIEIYFLTANFQKVEVMVKTAIDKAKNVLDQIKVYQIQILSYYADNYQHEKATKIAIEAIEKLGAKVPKKEDLKASIENERMTLQSFLENNNIEDLYEHSQLTDPKIIGLIQILQQISTALVTINSPLKPWTLLYPINLCIKYGNSPESIGVYSLYSYDFNLGKDIDPYYQFGELAMRLLQKYKYSQITAKVFHQFYSFIFHWKKSLTNTSLRKELHKGFQEGVESGDLEFASYCGITYCLVKFFGGVHLEEVNRDMAKYTKLIEKIKLEYQAQYMRICRNMLKCFLTENKDKYLVISESLEKEQEYLASWTKTNAQWLLFISYFSKTILSCIFKDYKESVSYGIEVEKYIMACSSYVTAPQYKFYASLAILGHYQSCNPQQQQKLLETINKNQKEMRICVSYCLENFQHKYNLIEAEKARVLDNHWQAAELYEKAIQGAKKYEFIHEEAIAYERAAEFYLSLDRQEIGKLYLRNAYHCYSRWGAMAKLKHLEAEYPQLLLDTALHKSTNTTISTISTTGSGSTEVLDLSTVIKASQALAGEIQLDKLLEQLMSIAIENAGAQKGILILDRDKNWVIEAQRSLKSQETITLQSIPIDSPTSDLSSAIANYVIHSQETVVLNDAVNEGQYTRDPYIIANQPKSVLCTPLINQGKLSGILYLENNLTANAFTSDRVELLQTLSAQAAISIENARLYDRLEEYNRTLEQRVKERTAELSQTVEVLEKTQAELKLENELLKSDEQADSFDYQIGGSLNVNAPTYVVRSADRHLYQAMRQGEFCYTFNARQIGKSSLMVRIMNELHKEGYRCISIDLTGVGSENITPDQWYKGIAVEMWRKFKLLKKFKLTPWWKELTDIPAPQRLKQFIEEVVLTKVTREDSDEPAKIVIFLDEIDCILSLPFPVNDFFALIRACYNQRAIDPIYDRLTFALFGAATPSTLISDPQKTPFNIGRPIHLEGFKVNEAQPLLYGLTVNNPQTVLKAIIDWTGGQPFLTQKVCSSIRNAQTEIPPNGEEQWIADLVQENILKNWEAKDDPEHLKTVRDRILKSDRRQELLSIYQQIVLEGEAAATYSETEKELLLSGLAIAREGKLKVNNRIYQSIFDRQWVEQQLSTPNSQ